MGRGVWIGQREWVREIGFVADDDTIGERVPGMKDALRQGELIALVRLTKQGYLGEKMERCPNGRDV